ncbi:M23 family metallopeptidase [Deinococcus sp. UR1]|uniref:M23 family metallopeptidase n=1 Tax=Deinococcus sp. UR1 TaxID=1704277 RepID=UPI000C17A4EF|nr:M23 family metallopeptidase [Deinococcus sp. UR1]PIG96868.1 peptidase M23 [Deinococcus sp. UR1]
MTTRRIGIEVEGKVILDADVTKAKDKIKGLETIGGGAVPTGAAPTVGGSPHAPPAQNGQNTPNASYFEHLAERSMHAINARYQQARTPAQFRDLGDSIERAMYNATQSGNKALIENLGKLSAEIKKMEEEFHRARTAHGNGAGNGGGGGAPGAPGGASGSNAGTWLQNLFGGRMNGVGQWLAGQGSQAVLGGLTGGLGGAVGGGLFAGAARFLTGPLGMGIGALSAANYAFNAVSNNVTEANAPARNEIMGYADLARQYGSSKDFMGLFRDPNGWTNNRFARLGYNATQAAHVAAIYDRPGGMMNDTESILQFARTTGTEDSRSAAIAQQIGRAGVGGVQGGNADNTLRILKLAMTEGVKSGIAQSETLNAMSTAVQRNTSRGTSTNDTALAFFASMSRRMNDRTNTNPMLRGEHGMNVMQGFMGGLGNGGGDQGVEFLLINSLLKKGLPDSMKAGMTVKGADGKQWRTDEGRYYDNLSAESPVEAARYLMQRAASGKNPQLLESLAGTIDDASGGSTYLKTLMYKTLNPSASPEQLAGIIGGGGISKFFEDSTDPAALERYKQGASLTTDAQGNNVIANQTMYLRVAESDREMLKSIASLNLTAGLEGVLADFKNVFAGLRMDLSKLLGGEITQGGSLAGRTGAGWKNPSTYKPTTPPTAGGGAGVDSGGGQGAGGGAGPTGFARTVSAVAAVESTNGTNPRMNDGSARGLFQMQSRYLFGPNGWAKAAGVDMRNPDGTAVSNEAQAHAWQAAHPDLADRIAVNRLSAIEQGVRAQFAKQGENVSDAHVAGIVAAIWHQNGGLTLDFKAPITSTKNPLQPLVSKGRLPSARGQIPAVDAGDGITHRTQYDKAVKAFNDKNLTPAAISGAGQGTGQRTQLAPGSETVVFTQGFGANKNNKKLGYDGRGHLGWDFRIGEAGVGGEAVHSRTEGKVVQAGPNASWGGNTVIVERADGYRVLHGHLGKVNVKAGQAVGLQTVIGTEGTSGGHAGMSPHLHIEVTDKNGRVVDPAVLFGNQQMKVGGRVKGFRGGGYTGDVGRDEVAGIVHGQEYVMTAEATRRFRPLLDSLNAGAGAAGGTVQVNLGGTLNVSVNLSAGARDALSSEYQAFQGRAGRIISADVRNARGVRG